MNQPPTFGALDLCPTRMDPRFDGEIERRNLAVWKRENQGGKSLLAGGGGLLSGDDGRNVGLVGDSVGEGADLGEEVVGLENVGGTDDNIATKGLGETVSLADLSVGDTTGDEDDEAAARVLGSTTRLEEMSSA